MADDDNGSNVTRATFLGFFEEVVDAKAAVDSANGVLRNVYKRAEEAGIDKKGLKQAIALDKQSGSGREESFKTLQQYMAWLGKPIGFQATMDLQQPDAAAANGQDESEAVAEHQVRRVSDAGHVAGKSGQDRASNPWTPGTFLHQVFDTGWMQGQEEIAQTLAQSDSAPKRRGRPPGSKNKSREQPEA